MESKIVDISNEVEGIDMPVCPLCDNEIEEFVDEVRMVKSNGVVALAHNFCVEEFVFTPEESEFNGNGLA